jgi:excisionase family DNA binding protein
MERNPLLDETTTAEVLGVTKGTLQVWRSTKRYPLPYVKVGRNVRYRLSDVEAFIQRRTVAA